MNREQGMSAITCIYALELFQSPLGRLSLQKD